MSTVETVGALVCAPTTLPDGCCLDMPLVKMAVADFCEPVSVPASVLAFETTVCAPVELPDGCCLNVVFLKLGVVVALSVLLFEKVCVMERELARVLVSTLVVLPDVCCLKVLFVTAGAV